MYDPKTGAFDFSRSNKDLITAGFENYGELYQSLLARRDQLTQADQGVADVYEKSKREGGVTPKEVKDVADDVEEALGETPDLAEEFKKNIPAAINEYAVREAQKARYDAEQNAAKRIAEQNAAREAEEAKQREDAILFLQNAEERSTAIEKAEAKAIHDYNQRIENYVNSLSDEDLAIAMNWTYETESGRDPIEDLQYYIEKAHEVASNAKPIEIDINAAVEDLKHWTEKRDALNTAFENQSKGALSLTDISALGADYATAYRYGAGHMEIDEQKAMDIQHQKAQEIYLTLAKDMLEVTRQEQACRENIAKLYEEQGDHANDLIKTEQDRLDSLTNQALELQIMMDILNQQTSDRAAYSRAKGTANADQNIESMRDNLLSDLQSGVKTGGMWTDDYQSAIKYVLGDESDYTTKQGNEAIKKVKKYSAKNGKGYDAAREDLIRAGILDKNGAVARDANGYLHTVQDAADALGVSKDYMYDILDMMTKYGAKWNYTDEYWSDMIDKADTLESKYATISAAMAAGADKEKLISSIVESAKKAEDPVKSLKESYAAMVKAATEGLSDEDAAAMTAQIQASFTKAVGDTSIDLSQVFDLEGIDWSSLDPDPITLTIVTDPADPMTLLPGDTKSTHTIYIKTVYGDDGEEKKDGKKVFIGGGGGHASEDYTGTANAFGTAYIGGKWGDHFGTHKALVGELGQELMVDPNTGMWHTIGDHGPEIITVPDDAIIFNDKQTAGILAGRGVYGRGTFMHAYGTAHFDGAAGRRRGSWDIYDKYKKAKNSGSGSGKDKDKEKDEDILGDEFKADKEMLEHQIENLSDMLNLYYEGTENWFDQQSNIIDTYSKAVKLSQLEYERLIAEGYDASYKSMRELAEQIIHDGRNAQQDDL